MKYSDYLKSSQAAPDPAPQLPADPAQGNRLDAMAAQMQAENYLALQAEARAVIDAETEPAAIAAGLAGVIFGETSAEADAVREAIRKARKPGGHEMALDAVRLRAKFLRAQLKKLDELQKQIAAEVGLALADERQLIDGQPAADAASAAIAAVMDFRRGLEDAEPADILLQAETLQDTHGGQRAAMGLLYGSLTEAAGAAFDLVQRQQLDTLIKSSGAKAGLPKSEKSLETHVDS